MTGRVVTVSSLGSVRVEVLGEGRAVTLPAALLLAADRVMRHCLAHEVSLDLDMVSDDESGWSGWEASTDMGQDARQHGETPWQALAALAGVLPAK